MSTPLPYPTLFIGDAEQAESRQAAQWLAQRGAVLAPNVFEALEKIEVGFAPALLVLAESWPGQISQQQIAQLRHAAPLARIVRLQGTWLEGSGRTAKPIPGCFRIHWQHWPFQRTRLFEAIQLHANWQWSQPLSATDDERLLFADVQADEKIEPATGARQRLIAIYARYREPAESLADLITRRGWQPLVLQKISADTPLGVDAVVYEIQKRHPAADELTALKAVAPSAPLVAIIGFPRVNDFAELEKLGFAAVVAKPIQANELIWQIEQATKAAPTG